MSAAPSLSAGLASAGSSPVKPSLSVTGFAPAVRTAIEEVADHLNAYHEDTIRLVALAAGAGRQALGAEINGVTPEGVEIAVQLPERIIDAVRVLFSTRRFDTDGVRGEMLDLVTWARGQVDSSVPTTTLETELAASRTLPTFMTTISEVRRLTPALVQLTVRGGLDDFRPIAPDQFLYLITAMPDGRPVEPGFTMAQYRQADGADQPPAAYYTVRRWRPERGEIDLWVVLHPHDRTVAQWATEVRPGTRVALWGPRSSWDPPEDTTHLLLIGDETALPAISAVLEQRPAGQPACVVLETTDTAHTVELPRSPGVDLTWVFRNGNARGAGSRLLEVVGDLDLDPAGLYAFGAAESRQIGAVRRHLRHRRGIPAAQVRMIGYWRRTATDDR